MNAKKSRPKKIWLESKKLGQLTQSMKKLEIAKHRIFDFFSNVLQPQISISGKLMYVTANKFSINPQVFPLTPI